MCWLDGWKDATWGDRDDERVGKLVAGSLKANGKFGVVINLSKCFLNRDSIYLGGLRK